MRSAQKHFCYQKAYQLIILITSPEVCLQIVYPTRCNRMRCRNPVDADFAARAHHDTPLNPTKTIYIAPLKKTMDRFKIDT